MYAKHETREMKSVTWYSDNFIYTSRSLSGSFIDLDTYSVGFRLVCWQNCGCHWPTSSVPYVGRTAGDADKHLPFRMLAELRVPLTNTFLSVCWQNCGCHWPTPSTVSPAEYLCNAFRVQKPTIRNVPASQIFMVTAVTQLYPLQNINQTIQLPSHVFHEMFTFKPTLFSLSAIVSNSLRKPLLIKPESISVRGNILNTLVLSHTNEKWSCEYWRPG